MTNIDEKQRIIDLLIIFEDSKSVEEDKKSIELYDFNINHTKSLLKKLDIIDTSEVISYLTENFMNESIAYGRFYLPNKNREKVENYFWRLKK